MAYIQCKSGGAETPTLLWTNPNPSTDKYAFDVALDLSNYQGIMIECRSQIFDSVYSKSIFVKTSDEQCMGAYSPGYGAVIRRFNIYDDKVAFQLGYYNGKNSTSFVCIPTRIWGYKKMNFPT